MTRALLLGASALALAGCAHAPAPSPTPEMVALPAALMMAPADAEAGDAELAALLPEDAGFDALVQRTLAEGPDLLAALARIDVARAGAARARAERLPQVDYDASVVRRRTNPAQYGVDFPAGIELDNDQLFYGGNLAARWDADVFGRLRANAAGAAYRLDAATADARAVRNAMVAEIAGAVIDWRSSERQLAVIAEDARAASELERLARVREEAGLSPGFASARAAAQASAAQARVAALSGQQAALLGRLVALTALPADDVKAMLDTGVTQSWTAPVSPALPSTLIARRPDVAASAARLAAADRDVAAAAAQRFPRLSLSAGLGLIAATIGGLLDSDSLVGNLTAGIAGPLLDFGRIDAEISRAEAGTQLAFQDYRKAVFGALGEAEAAYGTVAAADAEAAALREQAAGSIRATHLLRTRLDAGLADLAQVLEQQRLSDIDNAAAAAAEGRAQRARVMLWQALGGSDAL